MIKDLRGTESTQDACAKMRVGYGVGWFSGARPGRKAACEGPAPVWKAGRLGLSPRQGHPWASPRFLQKSTEHMKKVPTIILSITYKGVKFIDASNKVCFP